MKRTVCLLAFLLLAIGCSHKQKEQACSKTSTPQNDSVGRVGPTSQSNSVFIPDGYFMPQDTILDGYTLSHLFLLTNTNIDNMGNLAETPIDVPDTASLFLRKDGALVPLVSTQFLLTPDTIQARFPLQDGKWVEICGKFLLGSGDYSEIAETGQKALSATVTLGVADSVIASRHTAFTYTVGD